MTTQKKLKFSIDDVKQMSTDEINDNWDDVSDTLRSQAEAPSADNTEGDDDDE